MKKVLFLTRYQLDVNDHLLIKFDGQMEGWKKLGYEVYYLAYDSNGYYVINETSKKLVKKIAFADTILFRHVFSYLTLYISVSKLFKQGFFRDFSLAYIRKMPNELFFKRMLKHLKDANLINVIEIPTYMKHSQDKNRFSIRVAKKILSVLFKESSNVDFYTVMGDDCEGSYNSTPAINIDNGINVDNIPIREPESHSGINMLALASMTYWQGFDRIIYGLSEYKDVENVHLFLVGPDYDGSLSKWSRLASDLGVENKVTVTGGLYGDSLARIVNKSDVAFASLGTYRKGLMSGSVLKVRDYMARGIPFIYATDDAAIDDEKMPFVMRVANDGTPIDIESVVKFAKMQKSNESVSNTMREHARVAMSWKRQFEKLLSFIELHK